MHNKVIELHKLSMAFLEQDTMSLLSNEALVATAQDYMYIFALQFWDTDYLSQHTVPYNTFQMQDSNNCKLWLQ